MAKGMRLKLNYEVSRDRIPGAEITCLTSGSNYNKYNNYFYQEVFLMMAAILLFAGEFDGHWNYYLLNIATAGGRSADGRRRR